MKNKPLHFSTKAIEKFQGALEIYGKSMDLTLTLLARYDELQPPSTFMEFATAMRAGLVHVVWDEREWLVPKHATKHLTLSKMMSI